MAIDWSQFQPAEPVTGGVDWSQFAPVPDFGNVESGVILDQNAAEERERRRMIASGEIPLPVDPGAAPLPQQTRPERTGWDALSELADSPVSRAIQDNPLIRGFAGRANEAAAGANLLTLMPIASAVDAVRGDNTATDFAGSMVQQPRERAAALMPSADASFGEKLISATGGLAFDLPSAMVSKPLQAANALPRFLAATDTAVVKQLLGDAFKEAAMTARVPATTAGLSTALSVIDSGGTPEEAIKAGLADAGGTVGNFVLPLNIAGGIASRGLQGAAVNVVGEAAQNTVTNQFLPDELQRPLYDPEQLGISAVLGAPMAVALGERAPRSAPQTRARELTNELTVDASRVRTPESDAVDAGRETARAIFAEADAAARPDPATIDFTQPVFENREAAIQAERNTAVPIPERISPDFIPERKPEKTVPPRLAELEAKPEPTLFEREEMALLQEGKPFDRQALLADLESAPEPELIRNGTRVFYPGDVTAMRAKLAEAGLSEGMRKTNEDGSDAGLYFPAKMQAEVDAVLRKPSAPIVNQSQTVVKPESDIKRSERPSTRPISKDEMIRRGADGHLSRAYERYIPLDKLDGLEPQPTNNESDDGKYHAGREITQPIEARYDPENDAYMVYGGNHRIAQAKANGQTHIRAFVEPENGAYIGKSATTENPDSSGIKRSQRPNAQGIEVDEATDLTPAERASFERQTLSPDDVSLADPNAGYVDNASGESTASVEAQNRLKDEKAAGQTRALIDRDGTVSPLIGVDSADAVARAGQIIVQRGIGKDEWTVLSHGNDVPRPVMEGRINRARSDLGALAKSESPRVLRSTRKADPQTESEEWPIVKAGDSVDGRVVRKHVPNTDSISASFDDYSVLDGIREVPMSAFDTEYVDGVLEGRVDSRTQSLVEAIKESGEINPLIVGIDSDGAYIIEGGHRFDALIKSGARSIPAVVVIDESSSSQGIKKSESTQKPRTARLTDDQVKTAKADAESRVASHWGRSAVNKLKTRGRVEFITKQEVVDRGLQTMAELDGVDGFFDPESGKAYVIADSGAQSADLPGVLSHEVFHANAEQFLGTDGFKRLKEAFRKLKSRDKDIAAAYRRVPSDTSAAHVDEEGLAYLAQEAPKHRLSERLTDEAKLFLNRLGIPLDWLNAHAAAVRKIAALNLKDAGNRGRVARFDKSGVKYQKDSRNVPEDTPYYSKRTDDTKDLVATHNLSEENLMHALRIGGLPVPSLAISKSGDAIAGFGDITLVGSKSLIDPKRGAKTYGADVYSPRYPSVDYKLDKFALKRLNNLLGEYTKDNPIYSGEIRSLDDLTGSKQFRAYADDAAGGNASYHAMKPIAEKMLRDAGAEEVIFQGYTDSGNRRYKPHTIENVVKALKKNTRGGEGYNYGVASLRSKFTPQFRSIEQVKKNKGRLIGEDEFEKVKDEINNEFFKIADDLRGSSSRGKSFDFTDTVLAVMEDAPRYGVNGALKEYGIENVSEETQKTIAEFLQKLRSLPTGYFESKIPRVVDIGEFSAAVVPDDVGAEARSAIERIGLPIFEYKSGDVAARRAAVEKAGKENDILFSKRTPELESAMEKAGYTPEKGPLRRAAEAVREKIAAWRDYTSDEFKQSEFDRFHGIKYWEDKAGPIPDEQSPYIAARLSTGAVSAAEFVLADAGVKWQDGILQPDDSVKSLYEALKPVRATLPEFMSWMAGKRAQRLMKEGRENNFTQADIDELLTLDKGREAEFKQAAKDYADWNKMILDVGEQAGLINPESRKIWENPDYVPFIRAMVEPAGVGTKQTLANQRQQIKTLKGGKEKLQDPMTSIIQNAYKMIDASMKNHAMLLVADQVGHTGVLEDATNEFKQALIPMSQVKKALLERGMTQDQIDAMPKEAFEGVQKMLSIVAPSEPNVVRIMRDGKAEYYRVNDPLLLRSLTAFKDRDSNAIMSVMRWAKRLLTAGATATPGFIVRNWIRDTAHSYIIHPDKMLPGFKALEGAVRSFTKDPIFRMLAASGAGFGHGRFNAADPNVSAKQIKRALKAKGWKPENIQDFANSLVNTPAKLWSMYQKLGAAAENANRYATADKALKSGKSAARAAYEAKDMLDFSMQGDSHFIQFLADTLPFFNARLQGLYKLQRAGAIPGMNARGRVAAKGFLMAMASTAYIWAIMNDPEKKKLYDRLEDWDKDSSWHFWGSADENGERMHYRVPKPFEVGFLYGTTAEHFYRALTGDEAWGKLAERMGAGVYDQLQFNPWPQAIRPIKDVQANKSSFSRRPIENLGDEGKLPWDRYDDRTSPIARGISEVTGKGLTAIAKTFDPEAGSIGMGPKQIQYLWDQYTAGVGQYALGVADSIVRRFGTEADTNLAEDTAGALGFKALPGEPAKKYPNDIPGLGWFFKKEDGTGYTKYQTDLYDAIKEADQVNGSIKSLRESGENEKADALESGNQVLLGFRKPFGSVKRRLGQYRDQMDRIRKDPGMSPEEKRKAIDDLLRERNMLVESVYGDYRAARQSQAEQ